MHTTKHVTLEHIQELLGQGKTAEAIAIIDPILESVQDKSLLAEKAWAHYRRKEYETCREAIQMAGDTLRAQECLAQLAAYVDKDDATLERLTNELPGNLGILNAMLIRARDDDSEIDHSWVIFNLTPLKDLASREVGFANLLHNTGRFFHKKARGEEDLIAALAFLGASISAYGTETHWHHRAAASYWKSVVLEELFGPDMALDAARESLDLWRHQASLDPTNEEFKKKFMDAGTRHANLIALSRLGLTRQAQ